VTLLYGGQIKVVDRAEFVGMSEAEFEGQKAISSVIPTNAVSPVAWGYFEGDKTKSWFMTHFRTLRARPPQLDVFLHVLLRLHRDSVSPTGMFGFHVRPFYGPPRMIVDWT